MYLRLVNLRQTAWLMKPNKVVFCFFLPKRNQTVTVQQKSVKPGAGTL